MPGDRLKRRLAQEISLWRLEGEIDEETQKLLEERYDVASINVARIARQLGVLGLTTIVLGLLGLIAASAGSLTLTFLILLGLSVGFGWMAQRPSHDPDSPKTQGSKFLVVLAFLCFGGSLVLLAGILKLSPNTAVLGLGGLWIGCAIFAAYKIGESYLLLIGLVLFFHWVGSWSSMFGRATYAFSIQDPFVMSLVSIGIIFVGQKHDEWDAEHGEGFAKAYLSLGLIYLNMSLLILSSFAKYMQKLGYPDFFCHNGLFVIAGFGAAIIQMMLGARWHSKLFTGFGVTFFAIHLFTRLHEYFWDVLGKGLFLFFGGLLLLLAGLSIQKLYKPQEEEVSHG